MVGIAGFKKTLTAFALEADIPALLREGASGALGGQLGSEYDVLTFRNQVAGIPLEVNEGGKCVLSVAALVKGPPRFVRRPELMAAYCEWVSVHKRPDLAYGGLRLPLSEDGLY